MNKFKREPLHDWCSDGADSYRYCAQAVKLGWCSVAQWGDMDYSELNRAAI